MKNKFTLFFTAALSLITLQSCANRASVFNHVNSFSSNEPIKCNYIYVISGLDYIRPDDLEFAEYKNQIIDLLVKSGYQYKQNISEACLVAFLSYGVGDKENIPYSYTIPEYGQVGGGSTNVDIVTKGPHGKYQTKGNVSTPPVYGVTGYSTIQGVKTIYTRFLVLDAFDVTVKGKENFRPVWKLKVISKGSSNDLRYIFPFMVQALNGRIGTNSNQKMLVFEDNMEVKIIKE